MKKTAEAETEILKTERSDLQKVDHRNIVVEEGFNHRNKNNYGDIEALALNITANGVMDALLGHKVKGQDKFILTEGARRLTAIKLAFKNHIEGKAGFEDLSKIKLIPMRMVSSNKKDRLLIQASTGFGKVVLTDLEKAGLYKELIELSIEEGKKRGEAIKELISRLGISQATVYNSLKLNDLDDDIKGFIESGQISGGTVVTIIREINDVEAQKDAILKAVYKAEEQTKKDGSKKKATSANVEELNGLKTKSSPLPSTTSPSPSPSPTSESESALQRLKEISKALEESKVNNMKARILFELVDCFEDKSPLSRMINIFLD